MATIKERLMVIETDIKYIKKWMYILLLAMLGSNGIQYIQ